MNHPMLESDPDQVYLDMENFIFLSTQRSGYAFLRIWLNSHSKIDSHGEVFLAQYKSRDELKMLFVKSSLPDRLRLALHHTSVMN